MSEYIDERIVSIKFDNSGFAEKVSETQESLDNLNKSLQFDGANEGGKALTNTFKDISTEAKKVDLSPIGTAVENIGEKFNALQTIATGVFLKIGADAVEMGKKLIKSVSIDPIAQGFDKYQSILTSQMTLTAALGGETEAEIAKNEGKIKSVLEELTWYADETSYSLDDMIRNVSQFANYGIDLEDAKTAMMGIANASAKSGAPLAAASHAMEGFSKAMGQGYMSYQNWRTWLNSSKITTLDFKNTMLDTAKEFMRQGVVISDTVRMVGDELQYYESKEKGWQTITAENLEQSLTKGQWLTNDVMLAGLAKYSASMDDLYEATDHGARAVSELFETGEEGFDKFSTEAFKYAQQCKTLADVIDSLFDATSTTWYRIFQSLIGDYKQTVDLWSNFAEYLFEWFVYPLQEVAGMIKEFAESNSNIMDETTQKAMTMREVIVGSFMNIMEAISSVINPIKEAFNAVFNPLETMPKVLQNGVEKFYSFTQSLILTDEKADKLRNTFINIFGVLRKIWDVISWLVSLIKNKLFPVIKSVSKAAINIVTLVAKGIIKLLSIISSFLSKTLGIKDYIQEFKDQIIDMAYSLDEAATASEDNASAVKKSADSYKTWNSEVKEYIDNAKKAKKATSSLNSEKEKSDKSYVIKGGYDGQQFLTYEQAQEKENNKVLAELIEKYKVTEKQYLTLIKLMQAQDAGVYISAREGMKAVGLEEEAFSKLWATIAQTMSAYKSTDQTISRILNKDAEAEQWQTIWDGINKAQKETLITYGDEQAALHMYYHQNIKDYAKISEAIGAEEWQIRKIIEAYEEAYAVEKKLAKEKKKLTAENIDAARQELGFIKRKNEETKKESKNTLRDQSIAQRNARIQARRNQTINASAESSKKAGKVISDTLKQIPIVGSAFSVIQKVFGTVNEETEKSSDKLFEVTTSIENHINAAAGKIDGRLVTSKDNLYEVSDAAEEVSKSVDKIGTSSEAAAKSLTDSAKTMAKNLKAANNDSKKSEDKKEDEKQESEKSFGDSMTKFFDETSFDKESEKYVSKFNEIWSAIRAGFEKLKEDFKGFFKDPLASLSNALTTISATFENIKNIIFPKVDEANVAGASAVLENQSILDKILASLQKVREFLDEPIHWHEFWNLVLLNKEIKIISKILKNFANSIDITGIGNDVLKIAFGITLLVGALFGLSKIDSAAVDDALDLFERLAWILGILTGGIAAIMAIYNVSSVKNIPSTIESVLTNVLGGKSIMQQVAEVIVDVSKGLAIMTASLAGLMLVMHYIDDPDAVYASIGIITAFMIAIFGIVILMAEITSKNNALKGAPDLKLISAEIKNDSGSIASTIMAFAKALMVYVGAFVVITKVVEKYFTKDNGDFDLAKFSTVSGILIGMTAAIFLIAEAMLEIQKKMRRRKIDENYHKQIKAISKMINPMIHGLIIFVGAFWAISEIVKDMPDTTLASTSAIFGGMVLLLLGLIASMIKAAKSMRPKDAEKIKEIGKAIDLMSVSIILIGGALAGIFAVVGHSNLDGTDYIGSGLVFAAAIGAFIGLVALVAKKADKMSAKDAKVFDSLSKSIAIISASILIISAGLAAIFAAVGKYNLETNDYISIGIILSLAIGALAGITYMLLKHSEKMSLKEANRLKEIGKVVLMIGGALTVVLLGIAAVIKAFSDYKVPKSSQIVSGGGGGAGDMSSSNNESGLIWGIVAIVGIFAIMIAELGFIAKKLNPADAAIIKALGIAMIEIAAAVSLIGLTIAQLAKDLSGVDPEAMKASLITIGAVLGVLVVLFGIITAVIAATGGATGAGAMSMAAAVAVLAGLATVLLLISTSVYVLAKAIEEMVVAISSIGEANQKLITGLETIRDAMPIVKDIIIETVKAIIVGIIRSITESITEIAKAIVECFTGILQTIAENAPKILDALETITPVILKVITLILTLVFQALTEAMPKFREWFIKILDVVEEGIADILQFLIDEGVPKLEEIIGMILAFLLDEVLPKLKDTIIDFVKWLGDLGVEIVKSLTKIWTAVQIFITDVVFPGINKIWKSLLTTISNLINDLLDFLEKGVHTWGSNIVDIIVALIDEIGNGITRILDALERLLINVADGILKFFETSGRVLAKLLLIPKKIVDGFIKELKEQFGLSSSGKPKEKSKLVTIGKNIIDGIINGITNFISGISDVAKRLAKAFLNALRGKDGVDTNSPSKKTYQIGEWVGEGFIDGINDSGKAVSKSAKNLSNAFLKPMTKDMDSFTASTSSMFAQLVDADMDVNPTITPVFDMSNWDIAKKEMTSEQIKIRGEKEFSEEERQIKANAAVLGLVATQQVRSALLAHKTYENVETYEKVKAMMDQLAQKALEKVKESVETPTTNYNYTQNNYSPKALSEIEIYRRTNDQLNFRKFVGG